MSAKAEHYAFNPEQSFLIFSTASFALRAERLAPDAAFF
jgi:hypothetical protein